jgi:hypothetical protein
MTCFKVNTLTFLQTVGKMPVLVGKAEAIHWGPSSRAAVRAAGCPAGIVSNGQGSWSDAPRLTPADRGRVIRFSVWRVNRYRRAEAGWGKGPGGTFLEGYAPPS